MNHILKIAVMASISLSTLSAQAEDSYSVGLGMGTLYSGVGVNVAMLSKHDMKYISGGCLSYSSFGGVTCGAGIGWIKTDLFDANSDNHGFGLYLGAVGTERRRFEDKALYGAGIGYHYFFRGIANSGGHIGVSVTHGRGKSENGSGVIFEFGYQF